LRRLVVAALLLGLALAAVWFVRQRAGDEASRARAEAKLVDFDERDVHAVLFVENGTEYRVERDADAGWQLTAPLVDRVDAVGMSAVLSALQYTTVTDRVEEPGPLADYGLDPPRVRIQLLGPVGEPRFEVGDVTIGGGQFFARLEGRPGVLIVDRSTRLDRVRIELLRARKLLDRRRAEVRALRFGDDLELAQRDGTWWIDRPLRIPAAAGKVERLLGALEASTVTAFIDDAGAGDARYGLDDPQFTLEVAGDGWSRRFAFGAVQDGSRWLTTDDRAMVLAVQDESIATMPRTLAGLASERLTAINRYQVVALDCDAGGAAYRLTRDADGNWTDGDGAPVDGGAAVRRVASLVEARVAARRGSDPTGRPRATCRVALEGGGEDRLVLYAERVATVESMPGALSTLAAEPVPLRAQ
jgi:hypothetical protein